MKATKKAAEPAKSKVGTAQTEKMAVRDCSPFVPQPDAKQAEWLRRLATSLRADELVVGLADEREEDEPIVYCDRVGTWWAGRYVGTVVFEGRSLNIAPRLGMPVLMNWLSEARSLHIVDLPGTMRQGDLLIVQLLAAVWVQELIHAARHGLPSLRKDVATRADMLRGRLDVGASVSLIAQRSSQLVSVRSERSLDHAASDAIVAAYMALRRWIGDPAERWLPPRARELMPHLQAVTGPRPRVPTKAELARIRYTPITAPFAPFAELSRQIATRQGLIPEAEANGDGKGLLIDVAELWEMYVLNILRKAAFPLTVQHGTRENDVSKKLLCSVVNGQGMGTLIPDAILRSGDSVRGIVDAKYKRIHPGYLSGGPQREDLYQMTAYLARYVPDGGRPAWGVLAYPEDPDAKAVAPAEALSPWTLDSTKKMGFIALPHDPPAAIGKLRQWLARDWLR